MDSSKKTYWTDDNELVEKYVLGKIPLDEMKRLDAEIADSESSKEKLRHELQLAAGVLRYARDEMKKSLKKKIQSRNEDQFQRYNFIGLAAAIAIIFIGIGVFRLYFNDVVVPKKFSSKEIIFKESFADSIKPDKKESNIAEERKKVDQKVERKQKEKIVPQDSYPIEIEAKGKNDQSYAAEVSPRLAEAAEAQLNDAVSLEKPEMKSIWLVGRIVMIAQERSASTKSFAQSETQFPKSSVEGDVVPTSLLQRSKNIIVKRGTAIKNIILQQRSYSEIPSDRKQQRAAVTGEMETLLEKTSDGLLLTMYDDRIQEIDFQSARIETVTDDSLIVVFSNQKITYRLPSEWSIQQTNTLQR